LTGFGEAFFTYLGELEKDVGMPERNAKALNGLAIMNGLS